MLQVVKVNGAVQLYERKTRVAVPEGKVFDFADVLVADFLGTSFLYPARFVRIIMPERDFGRRLCSLRAEDGHSEFHFLAGSDLYCTAAAFQFHRHHTEGAEHLFGTASIDGTQIAGHKQAQCRIGWIQVAGEYADVAGGGHRIGRKFQRRSAGNTDRAAGSVVETLLNSIAQLDQRMNHILSPQNPDDPNSFPGANLLSIPGIGPKTLAAILSVVGADGHAYPDGKSFIGYIGFFPKIYESGETRRDNVISKRGPAYIRRALYIAAVACLKHNPEFKALYDRKISQGKTAKQALICIAKKLAHLCLSMLKSGESYNPSRVFMPV